MDTVSELVTSAAELFLGMLVLSEAHGREAQDLDAAFEALVRRLDAYEHAVLAGEVTYRVRSEEAGEAAARMRELLAGLAHQTSPSCGGPRSLWVAAVELASVLVRAAGNAELSGGANEAPEARSPSLDHALRAIELELAREAQTINAQGDVAAHHLAAALRVRAGDQPLEAIASRGVDCAAGPALAATRHAWLVLATHEYLAVSALDSELGVPTYRERFENLTDAIVEGAANVVCGARLASRPGAFRHRSAWRHQTVALTYALEAYVAGLRGDAPSFARAQLIALTRLIRAVAAIALLDLRQAACLSSNGRAKPATEPSDRIEEE